MSWSGYAGVVEAGGEGVAQAVRAELAGRLEAGASREPADEAPGLRFVHAPAVVVEEQRAAAAAGEVAVEGAFDGRGEGFERVVAALARDPQDAVAELVAEV